MLVKSTRRIRCKSPIGGETTDSRAGRPIHPLRDKQQYEQHGKPAVSNTIPSDEPGRKDRDRQNASGRGSERDRKVDSELTAGGAHRPAQA